MNIDKMTTFDTKGGDKMTNTEFLELLIKESGLKKGHIAEQLGLTRFGLAKKITNETEFKASEIDKLTKLLGITDPNIKEEVFFAQE